MATDGSGAGSAGGADGSGAGSGSAGKLPKAPAVEKRTPPKKKRRRAVRISEADQRIIDAGGSPSWEQIRPFEPNKWDGKRSSEESVEPESARDRAFRENRPPHW